MSVPLEATAVDAPPAKAPVREPQRMTIVAFSGDMDKLFATLSIASTAAAMGSEVTVFATFWGLHSLRAQRSFSAKSMTERAISVMLPRRTNNAGLSRMNMLGLGPRFFRSVMKRKNVAQLEELIATSKAVGVRFVACSMSMDVMGIREDELLDGIELAGAATCVQDMMRSRASLFI